MPIDLIEGKWKMNQDRQVADREGVIVALTDLGGDHPSAVAAIMRNLGSSDLRKP